MDTGKETARALLAILPLIHRLIVADLRQEADPETSMPQFRVLAYLAEEALTLSEIARRRHVSLQAAGILVQGLVERGWISRMPDPDDRRQANLHLTELGRAQYERVNERMLAHLSPLMEKLSSEESVAVGTALPALRRVLIQEENTDDNA